MNYKIVTHKKDIDSLVKLGKYDYVDSDIKQFPYEETDAEEIELINFSEYVSSEDAIKELDQKGYRPATATELLIFGSQHPEVQREKPIAALGTVQQVRGGRLVACLSGGSPSRSLRVMGWAGDWDAGWCFAAVRKSPLEPGKLDASALESLEARISELEEFKKKVEKIINL